MNDEIYRYFRFLTVGVGMYLVFIGIIDIGALDAPVAGVASIAFGVILISFSEVLNRKVTKLKQSREERPDGQSRS